MQFTYTPESDASLDFVWNGGAEIHVRSADAEHVDDVISVVDAPAERTEAAFQAACDSWLKAST